MSFITKKIGATEKYFILVIGIEKIEYSLTAIVPF